VKWIKPVGAVAAGLAIVAGTYLASGEPRLTLLNTALQFDHPWHRGVAALAAAGGALLLAVLAPRTWARVAFGLGTAYGLWVSLELLRYRVVSGRQGLAVRGPLGETSLAWSDVVAVDRAPALLVVRSKDAVIRVETRGWRAVDRAALERNVAGNLRPHSP
jgi:hypothetical protein